jgi:peptidyl-prolyl cis-trans isomerase C
VRPSQISALLVLALSVADARADDADPIVVRVGSSSVRASEISHRLATLPAFQLRTFGETPADIKRHFVDAVLVPELLFENEAAAERLAAAIPVRHRIREALSRGLTSSLADTSANVGESELHAYYDAHPDDFKKPERIRISRILLDDAAAARALIADARGTDGPERWMYFARDHSLDAATKMRSGSLGFVYPDGHTEVPQLDVDPALYVAASKVRDGELVPDPIPEAGHLAVVWRRGTLPKVERSFEDARDSIRELIARDKGRRSVTDLVTELRARDVKDVDAEALESAFVEPPPSAPAPHPSGSGAPTDPLPHQTDLGLR